MIRQWLQWMAELSGPQLHLLFLMTMTSAAALLVGATALALIAPTSRDPDASLGRLTRGLGIASSLGIGLGLWLALDTLAFGSEQHCVLTDYVTRSDCRKTNLLARTCTCLTFATKNRA